MLLPTHTSQDQPSALNPMKVKVMSPHTMNVKVMSPHPLKVQVMNPHFEWEEDRVKNSFPG